MYGILQTGSCYGTADPWKGGPTGKPYTSLLGEPYPTRQEALSVMEKIHDANPGSSLKLSVVRVESVATPVLQKAA